MTAILWRRGADAVRYEREEDFRERCPAVTYHWEELDGPGTEAWGWIPYGDYLAWKACHADEIRRTAVREAGE